MAADGNQPLTPDEARTALERIFAWRVDTEAPVACPRCNGTGLTVVDRSTRPYAEWYALSCASCGLDTTLHIPMSPPAMQYD